MNGKYWYEYIKEHKPDVLGKDIIDYVEQLKLDKEALKNQIIPAQCANIAEEYAEEQLTLSGVVDSKRFTDTDLLNGYQAGCIEQINGCRDLGLDYLKEIKEDGKKWVKRYTE